VFGNWERVILKNKIALLSESFFVYKEVLYISKIIHTMQNPALRDIPAIKIMFISSIIRT